MKKDHWAYPIRVKGGVGGIANGKLAANHKLAFSSLERTDLWKLIFDCWVLLKGWTHGWNIGRHQQVQQKQADIQPVCTAANPTEAGQMSGFCRSGLTRKGLPIGIWSALSVNGWEHWPVCVLAREQSPPPQNTIAQQRDSCTNIGFLVQDLLPSSSGCFCSVHWVEWKKLSVY